jgi:hypothetical protein
MPIRGPNPTPIDKQSRPSENSRHDTSARKQGLGAYLDAILAGVNEYDSDNIAKVIERRPLPSYEERMAVFLAYGKTYSSFTATKIEDEEAPATGWHRIFYFW